MEKQLFHERLKHIRLQRQLSLRKVAQAAEVPVSTYREWEAGRKIIGEPYEKIAQALNVSLYTLLTGKTSSLLETLGILSQMESLMQQLRQSLASYEGE